MPLDRFVALIATVLAAAAATVWLAWASGLLDTVGIGALVACVLLHRHGARRSLRGGPRGDDTE